MSRWRVVAFCLMSLLIPPLARSAPSKNSNTSEAAAQPKPSSAITSVHELQIPEKAREACNKGTQRFAAKDSAGSVVEFQKAIKAFPGYYEAYAKLGAAELDLGHWDKAESAFRKSIELSGGHYAPATFGLGLILGTVREQFAEAESVIRGGLEIAPAVSPGISSWRGCCTPPRGCRKRRRTFAKLSCRTQFRWSHGLLLAQIHLAENNFSAVVKDLDAYLDLGITGPWTPVRALRAHALGALSKTPADSEIAEASR